MSRRRDADVCTQIGIHIFVHNDIYKTFAYSYMQD